MKIAIDLDDTIADNMSAMAEFHNKAYGTNHKRGDFFSDDLSLIWKCSEEERLERVWQYVNSPDIYLIRPFPDAIVGLSELKKLDHDLHLVTARYSDVADRTKLWLEKHFAGIFSSTNFANTYGKTGERRKKSEILKDLDIKLLVDDSARHALDCATAGIKVLLVDAPWNQNIDNHPNIERVYSWKEIIEQINVLE